MKHSFCTFAVAFLWLLFFSCQSRQAKENNQHCLHEIDFERNILDSVYSLTTQGKNMELQMMIYYPVCYHNTAILDSLQHLMTASAANGAGFEYDYRKPEVFLQRFADYQIEKFRAIDTMYDNDGLHYSYEFISETDSISIQRGIFCFMTSLYLFEGGAHGLSGKHYTCVDLETGRKLAFNDVFTKDSEEALTVIIKRIIAEKPQEYDYFDTEIKPSDNFYFDSDGVIFVYNPYEIAPYSVGVIEIYVPLNEIAPFILLKRLLDFGHPTAGHS